jgi:hypothetical protein
MGFGPTTPTLARLFLSFVSDSWRLLEPSKSGLFPKIFVVGLISRLLMFVRFCLLCAR